MDMVYIKAVWQFDKTHNVNSFLALICGRACLRYIFLFIYGLLILYFIFYFFCFDLFCFVQRRERVIWDLRIAYVSDFKYQRLDMTKNCDFTSGS